MQHLFRLAQRSKPEVSVEQYGALLSAAWEASMTRPSLHGFPGRLYSPSDDEDLITLRRDFPEYAKLVADAWDQLNARRLELEAVRPDSRLSRVHEEAVKAFRADLELKNARGKLAISILALNLAEAQEAERELNKWNFLSDRIAKKVAVALREVRQSHPALFAALALPPIWVDMLDDLLDLNPRYPDYNDVSYATERVMAMAALGQHSGQLP